MVAQLVRLNARPVHATGIHLEFRSPAADSRDRLVVSQQRRWSSWMQPFDPTLSPMLGTYR